MVLGAFPGGETHDAKLVGFERNPMQTKYREVFVDRTTATRTQTLKWGREGRKPAGSPRKTSKRHEPPQKLRDPAPT